MKKHKRKIIPAGSIIFCTNCMADLFRFEKDVPERSRVKNYVLNNEVAPAFDFLDNSKTVQNMPGPDNQVICIHCGAKNRLRALLLPED